MADLTLGCGCSFTVDRGELRVNPCTWEHADHWVLLAIEVGLGAGGIVYPERH